MCTKIYRSDCKSEVEVSISEMPTVKSEFRSLKYEDTSRPMYGDHDPQALIIIISESITRSNSTKHQK